MNGLWIRSQNKERLIFTSGVRYGLYDPCDGDETSHCIMVNEHSNVIGTYATEKRALEVLDEIQAWIDELEIDTVIIGTTYINGTLHYLTEAKAKELMRKNVFEMPEK